MAHALVLPEITSVTERTNASSAPSAAAIDAEEIYQLVKRADVDPREVEERDVPVLEVCVMWRSAILHVGHVGVGRDFVFSAQQPAELPASAVFASGLGVGAALISASAAVHSYALGAVGTLVALAGAGVGGLLDHRNAERRRDASVFVVDGEKLQGQASMPIVIHGDSGPRFVFPPESTGELHVEGAKRSLAQLIVSGDAKPSSTIPGAYELAAMPGARVRMEVAGFTVLAKTVARGKRVGSVRRRDAVMFGAFGGASAAAAIAIAAMRLAVAGDGGLLSPGTDEDRLAALRGFVSRQMERQAEQPTTPEQAQASEASGARARGQEGRAGSRTAPARNGRVMIRNNGGPPRIAVLSARDRVQDRGIFASLGAPGGGTVGGASGIVTPFGADSESGLDASDANGNLHALVGGDAPGYGGLGELGAGVGGGNDTDGLVGMDRFNTIGGGYGPNGRFGSDLGRRLVNRVGSPPTLRPAPPSVVGMLAPEAIRRVVLRNLGQVSHCHEQGLAQNPNLEGRVVIRFAINGNGSVLTSSVSQSSVQVPSVGTCIADAVRRWQFPQPEGGGVVMVNYPFTLQRAE